MPIAPSLLLNGFALSALLALTTACSSNPVSNGSTGTGGGGGAIATSTSTSGGGGGSGGAGGSADSKYKAQKMTGMPLRYVLLQRDPDLNRCARILVLANLDPAAPAIDVATSDAVQQAELTNDVTDCTFEETDILPVPHGLGIVATSRSGSIDFDASDALHPTVTLHATLSFMFIQPSGGFPPASVKLDVDHLLLSP